MNILIDAVFVFLVSAGVFFFFAGSVGVNRLPDVLSRLHALSKADNLGLGLIVLGLIITEDSWSAVIKLILIWFSILVASASLCFLIAREAYSRSGEDSIQ